MVRRNLVFGLVLVAAAACDFPSDTSTSKAGVPSVASYTPRRFMVDLGAGAIVSEPGAAVSAAFFKDAKVAPLSGRALNDADQSQTAVVLSEALWKERFSSRDVTGQELVIDDRRMMVVGIMPESFKYPEGARLWVKR